MGGVFFAPSWGSALLVAMIDESSDLLGDSGFAERV